MCSADCFAAGGAERAHATRAAAIGSLYVFLAAVGFSAKSVIVKLVYTYHVDAATLMALRMAFSLLFFLALAVWSVRAEHLPRLNTRDWTAVLGLALVGYYLAAYLDLLGLQYITANLERLILFLFPTIVIALSALLFKRRITRVQLLAVAMSHAGIVLVFLENLQQPALAPTACGAAGWCSPVPAPIRST